MKENKQNEGFVLTGALMLLLIGVMVAGSFLFVSRQSNPSVTRWARYDQALLAAQTAVEKVKDNLYNDFKGYHLWVRSWDDLGYVVTNAALVGARADGKTLADILGTGTNYPYSAAIIKTKVACGNVVTIVSDSNSQTRLVFVTNTVSATVGGTTRTIEEVVRYTLQKSSVFNHAYFINNLGWFYNVDCVVNGDLRSNFDVEFDSGSLVLNGRSYAAGFHDISRRPSSWSWSAYSGDSKSKFFRPTYSVDQNSNRKYIFEYGYDYKSVGMYDGCKKLLMPFIDRLEEYKALARTNNGTVRIGTNILINNVYTNTGPSGITNAPDMGCIVLIGATTTNPIVIDGPVTVDRDLIIKGYYTGQGTIVAGRNIHIISNLTAIKPAQWKQPETSGADFTNSTLPTNLTNDFLGLCARGSIVLGDYLKFTSTQLKYMSTNFTRDSVSAASDTDIGYVSYTENGTNYFDGNYTNYYGLKCGAVATNGVPRKYYESSLSDNTFSSNKPAAELSRIDALIYNNHLTTGELAANAMFNGGIICRDEALIANGRFYMNWDPRIALGSKFDPHLPPELGPAKTIQWREVQP